MNSQAEQISDDDLASTISDDGRLSSDSSDSTEQGLLEVGVPPEVKGPSESSDLDEEPFSIDDFDSDLSPTSEVEKPSPDVLKPPSSHDDSASNESVDSSHDTGIDYAPVPEGQVSEFRKTLSALSRQLEVDKLTFLYQKLQEDGSDLPPLEKIASDIRGDSTLHPMGDNDLYSKRPLARLQGWISGLSFGVGRRAKKFSR